MPPRQQQTIADYAAIGLAPILIFVMLLSLAQFLMMVIYSGNYPGNLNWTLMFYTMGVTAIARLAIEESRAYANGYMFALGAASLFVMSRFFGGPISSAIVLFVIGYLADRIVHDCTIVDDGVDSSGVGIIDSGRLWLRRTTTRSDDPGSNRSRARTGAQPGRTVLYLALGALPLFGVGQFFLHDDDRVSFAAKTHLAMYLFASLSLLVATSFLNLRRYLRQRHTEMPIQTTIAWLAGGMAMIAVILMLALISPTPGKAVASFELPEFLKTGNTLTASRFGWGDEGAQPSTPGDTPAEATQGDQPPDDVETQSTRTEKGAPPGGKSGERDDGPPGDPSGGDQGSPQKGKGQADSPKKSDQPKTSQSKPSPESPPGSTPESPPESSEQPPSQSGSDSSDKSESQSTADSSEPSETPPSSEASDQPKSENDSDSKNSKSKPSRPDAADSAQEPTTENQSARTETMMNKSQLREGIAGFFKFIVILALIAIVVGYLYFHHQRIIDWINEWFSGRHQDAPAITPIAASPMAPSASTRPFSSFANPVGTAEPQQVVVITFEALQAWGREQGVTRTDDETPNEFVRRLVRQHPPLRNSAIGVVDAYNRIVYGQASAGTNEVRTAQELWDAMRPQL